MRGSRGGACSFGWACADAADAGDPRNGWLERQASGSALDAAARSVNLRDGPALIAAARQGSAAAIRALERPMHLLGTALAGAVGLLDPEVIVITGGVAAEMDLLAPMVREALERQLPPHLRGIAIRAGEFGPQAGLVGAAAYGVADGIGGTGGVIVMFIVLIGVATAFFGLSRTTKVDHNNVNSEWTGDVVPAEPVAV